MKPRYILIIQRLTIGMLSCLILVGCASFPGKQLPVYTHKQIASSNPKPSLNYDARAILGTKVISFGHEAEVEKIFQEEIQKVFRNSNAFSKFGDGIGSENYHLSLMLQIEQKNGLTVHISTFLAALTLGILPVYARDEFLLTADVKKGEQIWKHYQYKDYMVTWFGVFLVFLAPTHSPPDVTRDVIDNMLLNFLYDSQKDKIWEVLPK